MPLPRNFEVKMLYVVLLLLAAGASALVYDSYSGTLITPAEYEVHKTKNTTFWCTNEVEPCKPTERRRVDGSCNNLRRPQRGASHTPALHLLPLQFHGYNNARKTIKGDELPLSRRVRTTLLQEARIPDQQMTHLVTYFWLFMTSDVISFHDTVNYLMWKTHCCEERGKSDPDCISIPIPDDDPVHQFSNIRCLNLTRPFTFQSTGCITSKHHPERIVSSTTLYDLSQIYGNTLENLLTKRRLFKGGLLKYEVENGRMWPPSLKHHSSACILNQPPRETRCHDTGEKTISNSVLGTNLFTIWMWRHHNHIATELSRINPCWDDDQLFYAAREINIAMAVQIFFYEFYPVLLGEENLIKEGVLSPSLGFRDVYREDIVPQISLEYGFSLRWAHTIQNGIAKLYDTNGTYISSVRIVNLALRTGYLAVDDNLDHLTQGAFRQPAGRADSIVDPDMAQIGHGLLQRATDLPSSDLTKNRYLGIAPYIRYRKLCFRETINTFDDLKQAIDPEKIELLKDLYDDVKDIDLMAGIWVEKPVRKGRVPATLYCLVVDQLLRSIVSDRHWYERPNRPNAFTIDQLLEIRKASMARLLCDVGDKVTRIQPRAFLLSGPENEMVNCEQIPRTDLRSWADDRCVHII